MSIDTSRLIAGLNKMARWNEERSATRIEVSHVGLRKKTFRPIYGLAVLYERRANVRPY
jgi:hypothetical protein